MKTLLSSAAIATLLATSAPANAFVSIDLVRHTIATVKSQFDRVTNSSIKGNGLENGFKTVEGRLNEDGLTITQARTIHDHYLEADRNLLEAKRNNNKGIVANWELRQAIEYHEFRTEQISKLFRQFKEQNRIKSGSTIGINGEYSDGHKEGGSPHFQNRGN